MASGPVTMSGYEGILYVHESCEASAQVLSKARLLRKKVYVQFVEDLSEIPPWLNGTPILVSVASGEVLRGSASVLRALGEFSLG